MSEQRKVRRADKIDFANKLVQYSDNFYAAGAATLYESNCRSVDMLLEMAEYVRKSGVVAPNYRRLDAAEIRSRVLQFQQSPDSVIGHLSHAGLTQAVLEAKRAAAESFPASRIAASDEVGEVRFRLMFAGALEYARELQKMDESLGVEQQAPDRLLKRGPKERGLAMDYRGRAVRNQDTFMHNQHAAFVLHHLPADEGEYVDAQTSARMKRPSTAREGEGEGAAASSAQPTIDFDIAARAPAGVLPFFAWLERTGFAPLAFFRNTGAPAPAPDAPLPMQFKPYVHILEGEDMIEYEVVMKDAAVHAAAFFAIVTKLLIDAHTEGSMEMPAWLHAAFDRALARPTPARYAEDLLDMDEEFDAVADFLFGADTGFKNGQYPEPRFRRVLGDLVDTIIFSTHSELGARASAVMMARDLARSEAVFLAYVTEYVPECALLRYARRSRAFCNYALAAAQGADVHGFLSRIPKLQKSEGEGTGVLEAVALRRTALAAVRRAQMLVTRYKVGEDGQSIFAAESDSEWAINSLPRLFAGRRKGVLPTYEECKQEGVADVVDVQFTFDGARICAVSAQSLRGESGGGSSRRPETQAEGGGEKKLRLQGRRSAIDEEAEEEEEERERKRTRVGDTEGRFNYDMPATDPDRAAIEAVDSLASALSKLSVKGLVATTPIPTRQEIELQDALLQSLDDRQAPICCALSAAALVPALADPLMAGPEHWQQSHKDLLAKFVVATESTHKSVEEAQRAMYGYALALGAYLARGGRMNPGWCASHPVNAFVVNAMHRPTAEAGAAADTQLLRSGYLTPEKLVHLFADARMREEVAKLLLNEYTGDGKPGVEGIVHKYADLLMKHGAFKNKPVFSAVPEIGAKGVAWTPYQTLLLLRFLFPVVLSDSGYDLPPEATRDLFALKHLPELAKAMHPDISDQESARIAKLVQRYDPTRGVLTDVELWSAAVALQRERDIIRERFKNQVGESERDIMMQIPFTFTTQGGETCHWTLAHILHDADAPLPCTTAAVTHVARAASHLFAVAPPLLDLLPPRMVVRPLVMQFLGDRGSAESLASASNPWEELRLRTQALSRGGVVPLGEAYWPVTRIANLLAESDRRHESRVRKLQEWFAGPSSGPSPLPRAAYSLSAPPLDPEAAKKPVGVVSLTGKGYDPARAAQNGSLFVECWINVRLSAVLGAQEPNIKAVIAAQTSRHAYRAPLQVLASGINHDTLRELAATMILHPQRFVSDKGTPFAVDDCVRLAAARVTRGLAGMDPGREPRWGRASVAELRYFLDRQEGRPIDTDMLQKAPERALGAYSKVAELLSYVGKKVEWTTRFCAELLHLSLDLRTARGFKLPAARGLSNLVDDVNKPINFDAVSAALGKTATSGKYDPQGAASKEVQQMLDNRQRAVQLMASYVLDCAEFESRADWSLLGVIDAVASCVKRTQGLQQNVLVTEALTPAGDESVMQKFKTSLVSGSVQDARLEIVYHALFPAWRQWPVDGDIMHTLLQLKDNSPEPPVPENRVAKILANGWPAPVVLGRGDREMVYLLPTALLATLLADKGLGLEHVRYWMESDGFARMRDMGTVRAALCPQFQEAAQMLQTHFSKDTADEAIAAAEQGESYEAWIFAPAIPELTTFSLRATTAEGVRELGTTPDYGIYPGKSNMAAYVERMQDEILDVFQTMPIVSPLFAPATINDIVEQRNDTNGAHLIGLYLLMCVGRGFVSTATEPVPLGDHLAAGHATLLELALHASGAGDRPLIAVFFRQSKNLGRFVFAVECSAGQPGLSPMIFLTNGKDYIVAEKKESQ